MHYAKHLTLIFLIAATLTVNGFARSLVETENISPHPLRLGEKLTYQVKYRGLPAGKRTDQVMAETELNGQNVYHIRSEAKTRSLFRLYHFRNQQETYLIPTVLSPAQFRNQLEDRKYRATVTVNFSEGKAEYEKVSQRNPKAPQKRDKKLLEMPVGTQDELSMLYFLRCKQLSLGKTYFFPLLAKGKVQKATLTVERREVFKSKPLGSVRTLVLRTSNDSLLWVTDDSRRLPVRIEAKTKIGKMTATLEKAEFMSR